MMRMKMDTFCRWFLSLAIIFVVVCRGWTQERAFKNIENTYLLDNAGEIRLDNKYGDVTIYGWNKNQALIQVNIEVVRRNKEEAEDLLRRIHPEIVHTRNFIDLKTTIEEKDAGLLGRYLEKATRYEASDGKLRINYTLYVPERCDIEIRNAFGNIDLQKWYGNIQTVLEYGDLVMEGEVGIAKIDLKNGNLKARSVGYGDIQLKNGMLDLGTADRMKLKSAGSAIKVKEVSVVEIYSGKDQIYIEKTGIVTGQLEFSNLEIEKLQKELDLKLRITDLTVNHILNPEPKINLDQESSDININVSHTSLEFYARLEEGLLRLPRSFRNVESRLLDKANRIREINAAFGRKAEGKISIEGQKGVIVISEK